MSDFLDLWREFCEAETDMERLRITRLIGPIEVTYTRPGLDSKASALEVLQAAVEAELA